MTVPPRVCADPEEIPMFERFTARARRVIILAQEEARMLNHDRIGTHHLLLGLIHEGEGIAGQVLGVYVADAQSVRQQIEKITGRGEQPPHGHIPFTVRAKKVLELSLREALQLGHNYIGTEHLLLAILRDGDDDTALIALRELGVDPDMLGKTTMQTLGAGVKRPAPARKTPEHPARVKPQAHSTELTYVVEDGIDPLELRNLVDNIHHSLIHSGMPGTRITGLSLTDHTLRVVIS